MSVARMKSGKSGFGIIMDEFRNKTIDTGIGERVF